jgi:DNA-binding transcriptional regulator GbsR (MarR family)
MNQELQSLRRRFIESAGHFTQSLGAGRVLGQIFAHIYFSKDPQSLDDLTRLLEISKGSSSMAVRQLEQWGALRRVWVKGDRKDYYVATDEFGRIIRKALLDMIGRKMETSDGLLEDAQALLQERTRNGKKSDEDWAFIDQRVKKLQAFRDRAQGLWDSSILKMLLK